MDLKLEVIVPVSDFDRAKAFYTKKAGFAEDHDTLSGDGVRIVQLTPPGSACSIVIGTSPPLPAMEPGSLKGIQLTVWDVEAARAELAGRGVEVSDVQGDGSRGHGWHEVRLLRRPDGNAWAVQQYRGGLRAGRARPMPL